MKRLASVLLVAALVSGCGERSVPDPPAAPDPGGDEQADVPVPPRDGIKFGFNESPVNDELTPDQIAELAEAAGANAVRFPVDWRLVEPFEDAWDENAWSTYEAAYSAIESRGMTPLVSFGFAPTWARESGAARKCADFLACRYPPGPSRNEEWVEFSAEVADRFPRAIFEVWNEPNLVAFWRSGPDPRRFAELQTLASDAIRSRRSDATILTGGFAINQPVSEALAQGPADVPFREFLDQAYGADPRFAESFDGISFHPYPGGPQLGEGSLFAKAFADVRQVAAAHSGEATDLWITELGVSSDPAAGGSAELQADVLLRAYRRLGTMNDVRGIFVHRLVPPQSDPPNSPERGLALFTRSPSSLLPKPGYCEFVGLAGGDHLGC